MSVEDILNRLPKVKKTGKDRWIACCPAHEDRTPSLSIAERDGTTLLHCFGGCSPEDVMGAIGMEMHELFPPRTPDYQADKPVRFGGIRFTPLDALRCLAGEGTVVALLAADMAEGKVLSPDEQDRLVTACGRLAAGLEYLQENEIE